MQVVSFFCFGASNQRKETVFDIRRQLSAYSFPYHFNHKQVPNHPSNPWKIISKELVYDNPWIQVAHHEVQTPHGNPGIYGVVHFKNRAIGMVPLDKQGNTWLVGQYRFPLNEYSWEIPEGGCPEGEEPLDAARRELREETGLSADTWTHLGTFALSNSVSDEVGTLFLATGISEGKAEPEETEQLSVRKLPFTQALDMVLNGEIQDAISIMAILQVARRISV